MVVSASTLTSVVGISLQLIYREAFKRIGYNVDFVEAPLHRAELMVTSGQVDGELHRVKEYGDTRPTILRVPTPHFPTVFSAYSAQPLILKDGWDALKDTKFRVNYREGVLWAKDHLYDRLPANQIQSVPTDESGLNKLLAGRSDLFIDQDQIIDEILRGPRFRDTAINPADPAGHSHHRAAGCRL